MQSLLSALHPAHLRPPSSSQDEEDDAEDKEWPKMQLPVAIACSSPPPPANLAPKDGKTGLADAPDLTKPRYASGCLPFSVPQPAKRGIHHGKANSGFFGSFGVSRSAHFDPYAFMGSLKSCATSKDLDQGHGIHAQIVFHGFERTLSIGNALLNMYAKCAGAAHDGGDEDFFAEARRMFNRLQDRDVVSWTTLISAYVEHGSGEKALECFDQMKGAGASANAYTYACALKACNNILDNGHRVYADSNIVDTIHKGVKDSVDVKNNATQNQSTDMRAQAHVVNAIRKGKQIHGEVRKINLDSDLFVGSNLVRLYAKLGLFPEAWEVFYKMVVRDVVVWTIIIGELTEHGFGEEALNAFKSMRNEGIFPTSLTYVCILKACAVNRDIQMGREFHNEIELKGGFRQDVSVANSLMSMYARCGLLEEAQKVFDMILVPDVVSWNTLISGYSEHGHGEETISLFETMLQTSLSPTEITFSCVLKACGGIGAVEKGREIHRSLKDSGFENDVLVSNTLVAMYSKCGSLEEAQTVFDNIISQSIVSWNALITGYAGCGFPEKALELFQQMQQDELVPDNVTYSCVLAICGSRGALEMGRDVHCDIQKNGLTQDLLVCRSLISMYADCGSFSEAKIVFNSLHYRDSASWSLMMKYFGINHMGNMAIRCFEEMLQENIYPDAITFTCLLTACNHASQLEDAYTYLKAMKGKFGVTPISQHYTCILNLISQSGQLYEAERLLEIIGSSSTSEEMWAAVLNACKTYGEVELGVRCFEKLVEINPEDSAWYVLMADLYAHVGRWSDAYRIDELRKQMGAKKKAAVACIEVNKKVHEFVVGEEASDEVVSIMNRMNSSIKMDRGHLPHLNLVLKPLPDGKKEAALCEHAEKMAIAFGLLNTPQGTTLRVSKNLRMCIDCHNTSKIISKVEKREIIIRDSACIHHFKDNMCSCGDMY